MIRLASILFLLAAFVARGGQMLPSDRLFDWKNYTGYPVEIMINATQTISEAKTVYTLLGTNSTAAQINSAIAACPNDQVVQLTNGTYTLSGKINVDRGRFVLRGKGKWVSDSQGTRFKTTSGFTDGQVIHVSDAYDLSAGMTYTTGEVNLTNVVKDSQSITTMQAHGWSVGDVILLDQKTNLVTIPNIRSSANYVGRDLGTRPYGHFAKVTAVPTTTSATIVPPVICLFSNSLTPKAIKISGWVTNVGFEGFTIDTLSSTADNAEKPFQLEGLMDYWLYDVETVGNYYRGAWLYGSFRGTWQNVRMLGNRPIGADYDSSYTSDRAYGPYLGPHNTSLRIVDSVFDKLTLGVTFEGCSSGNALAYCYFTNMWWMSTGAGESKINFGPLMHGPCPSFNLIEGCLIQGRWRADALFGNSMTFTVHRNRILPWDRRTGGRTTYFQWYAVDLETGSHWHNITENVIGSGFEVTYEHNGDAFDDYGTQPNTPGGTFGDTTIWKLGYGYNTTGSSNHDTNVADTLIRWGNYDTLNDGIRNHASRFMPDTNSPASVTSYLYDSKPAWFGNRTWPPIDPGQPSNDASTNVPAAAKYLGIDIYSDAGGGPDNSASAVIAPGKPAPAKGRTNPRARKL